MLTFNTAHAEPDTVREAPVYRVHFWQRPSAEYAWNLDAYILIDAEDVTEVLRWIDLNSRGRRCELFVEVDDEPSGEVDEPRTSDLVRLLGRDPNEGEATIIGSFEAV